ncbi:hypothetical protein QN277_003905 [Acacia crassicarpa]|uniref:Uncharacterized protein n=1 Tax=Acacia crassicarpa TaxID=499986 RepID=A0AAE1IZC3_9FABA|nr:hypothetical protein QN277_003905 [Acacia crassicarpa]
MDAEREATATDFGTYFTSSSVGGRGRRSRRRISKPIWKREIVWFTKMGRPLELQADLANWVDEKNIHVSSFSGQTVQQLETNYNDSAFEKEALPIEKLLCPEEMRMWKLI